MPDRIIRDELLSSERYWSLSSDTARMLFCHLMLRADDFGIFRASTYTVRSTCFGLHAPTPDATSKMLSELNDCDLVRLYEVDHVAYGYVPRFKQRLRVMKSRHPLPPVGIRDNCISELISKMSDRCTTYDGHVSAEVKRSEEKRSKSSTVDSAKKRRTTNTEEPPPFREILDALPKRQGNDSRTIALRAYNARIREGIDPAVILAGAKRYSAYIRATGKEFTEFVKQASGFLGPSRLWEQSFSAPTKARVIE